MGDYQDRINTAVANVTRPRPEALAAAKWWADRIREGARGEGCVMTADMMLRLEALAATLRAAGLHTIADALERGEDIDEMLGVEAEKAGRN